MRDAFGHVIRSMYEKSHGTRGFSPAKIPAMPTEAWSPICAEGASFVLRQTVVRKYCSGDSCEKG